MIKNYKQTHHSNFFPVAPRSREQILPSGQVLWDVYFCASEKSTF